MNHPAIISIETNSAWDNSRPPKFSIITLVYNRRSTIRRTIDSVERQLLRDFEYIIVDDGSTETSDDIIQSYMHATDTPVMFIKKKNGGVHTARNAAYRQARGLLSVSLDSDDELTGDALGIFLREWEAIAEPERINYRGIVAQCMDEDGKTVCKPYPDGINSAPAEKLPELLKGTAGEHHGANLTSIMKAHPWPEPEGVNFVVEGLVWRQLGSKYRQRYCNAVTRIYHTDGGGQLTKAKTSIQSCKNTLWSAWYMLSNPAIYPLKPKAYLQIMLRYGAFSSLLKSCGESFPNSIPLSGFKNRSLHLLLRLPCYILSFRYKKRLAR